uniref:hypothetical protein n=1 Tax=Klebsiella aerogenes TaxID=548 RepID=UPI00195328D3
VEIDALKRSLVEYVDTELSNLAGERQSAVEGLFQAAGEAGQCRSLCLRACLGLRACVGADLGFSAYFFSMTHCRGC